MAGSATIGTLRVLLTANSAEFDAAMQKGGQSAQQFGAKAGAASQATGLFSGSLAKLVGAFEISRLIDRGVSALISWGREAILSAGHMVDLASKTGLSIETIQRMAFVAQQTSTDINAFTTAAFNLGVRLAGGGPSVVKAVEALELSYRDLMALSPEQRFDAVTRSLHAMEDTQLRNNIAVSLFGKVAKDILPAIEQDYLKLAAGATVASRAQLQAVDEASEAWTNFKTNATTSIAGVLGNLVLANQKTNALRWSFSPVIDTSRIEADVNKISTLWAVLSGRIEKPMVPPSPLAGLLKDAGLLKGLPPDLDAIEASLIKENKAALDATKASEAHATALGNIRDELSGKGLLANAADYVRIVGEMGGVSSLTRDQQDKLNALLADAIAKYAALGRDAPQALLDIYAATQPLIPATAGWGNELLKSFRAIGFEEPAATAGIANIASGIGTLTTLSTESSVQAGLLTGAYQQFGIKSRAELQQIADAAVIHFNTLRTSGTATPADIQRAFEDMKGKVNAANGTIPSFWESEIKPRIQGVLHALQADVAMNFAGMLTHAQGFKQGFLNIWDSIKQSIMKILGDLLNTFIGTFLKGMLNALTGSQGGFAGAFAGLFGGGGGIGGLLGGGAAAGAGAAGAGVAGAGAAGAGGAGAAAGGLSGLAMTGIGAGIAGAALLAWGIISKGLFRGGEEALKVNPARDQFIEGQGGFDVLAGKLHAVTQVFGGGAQFAALLKADTMDEYNAALEKVQLTLEGVGGAFPLITAAGESAATSLQQSFIMAADAGKLPRAEMDALNQQLDLAMRTGPNAIEAIIPALTAMAAEGGVSTEAIAALQAEIDRLRLAGVADLVALTTSGTTPAAAGVEAIGTESADAGTEIATLSADGIHDFNDMKDRGIVPASDAVLGIGTAADQAQAQAHGAINQMISDLVQLKAAADAAALGTSPGGVKELGVQQAKNAVIFALTSDQMVRDMGRIDGVMSSLAANLAAVMGHAIGAGDMAAYGREGLTTVDAVMGWEQMRRDSMASSPLGDVSGSGRRDVTIQNLQVRIGDGVNPLDKPSLEAAVRGGVRGAAMEIAAILDGQESVRVPFRRGLRMS